MKKAAWWAVCLVVVVGQSASLSSAENSRPGKRPNAQTLQAKPGPGIQVVGTITYDTGVNAGFPPDTGAIIIGNRFNSALGGPLLMTGMVTMWEIFPQNSGAQSFTFWGPPSTMNTAMLLTPYFMANLMANVFNQVTLPAPGVTTGPDFLVTFFGFFSNTPPGLCGLDSNPVNGQGFHALQGNYVAPNMTMIAPIAGRNAMMRVTGDILTPVELMNFKIQ